MNKECRVWKKEQNEVKKDNKETIIQLLLKVILGLWLMMVVSVLQPKIASR